MSDIWITDEIPARVLFVKGRSGLDQDCLVAYAEGDTKPLWIIDCHTPAPVCGLSGKVTARRVKQS
jgi:hypothetical protein